jgi:hypothetical protein
VLDTGGTHLRGRYYDARLKARRQLEIGEQEGEAALRKTYTYSIYIVYYHTTV